MERGIHNRIAQITRALFSPLITHDFNADHQSFAANIANDLELVRPIRAVRKNVFSHFPHFPSCRLLAGPLSPAMPPNTPDSRQTSFRANQASSSSRSTSQ